jgi:hypothetical protein
VKVAGQVSVGTKMHVYPRINLFVRTYNGRDLVAKEDCIGAKPGQDHYLQKRRSEIAQKGATVRWHKDN